MVTWAHDVCGNAVALATFGALADHLVIDSVAELELDAAPWPVFDIAASTADYPFFYAREEWIDLGALTVPQYADPAGQLHDWARAFVRGCPTTRWRCSRTWRRGAGILYRREDEGTQSPIETPDRGWLVPRSRRCCLLRQPRAVVPRARVNVRWG
jgi:hypothetical protein